MADRRLRSVTFPSSDGQEVQAWLGLPDGDGPFPMVLDIHGGPHWLTPDAFDPVAQAWLDNGFAWLSVNYRGSVGFGREFHERIWGDIGHWELEDMVAGRAFAVETGVAADDAVFVHGHGGHGGLGGGRADRVAGPRDELRPRDRGRQVEVLKGAGSGVPGRSQRS